MRRLVRLVRLLAAIAGAWWLARELAALTGGDAKHRLRAWPNEWGVRTTALTPREWAAAKREERAIARRLEAIAPAAPADDCGCLGTD